MPRVTKPPVTKPLVTTPNLAHPDDAYARLIAAHDGLSEAQSHAMNARLILILMNHIGNAAVLAQALQLARSCGPVQVLPASDRNSDGPVPAPLNAD